MQRLDAAEAAPEEAAPEPSQEAAVSFFFFLNKKWSQLGFCLANFGCVVVFANFVFF